MRDDLVVETRADGDDGLEVTTEAEAEHGRRRRAGEDLEVTTEAEAEHGRRRRLREELEAAIDAEGDLSRGREALGVVTEAAADAREQLEVTTNVEGGDLLHREDLLAAIGSGSKAAVLMTATATAAAGRSLYAWGQGRMGAGRDVMYLLLTGASSAWGAGLLKALEREGFRVSFEADAATGEQQKRRKLGLLLVDVTNLERDGLALARRYREEFGAEVLLVATAAAAGEEALSRARAAGFDTCLRRPGADKEEQRDFVRDLQIFLAGPADGELASAAASVAAGHALYAWGQARVGAARDVMKMVLLQSGRPWDKGLSAALEREGFRVTLVADEAVEIERVQGQGLGLLLIDMEDVALDSAALGRRLRAAFGAEVLLVATAATVGERETELCLAAGFDACLRRPGASKEGQREFIRDLQVFLAGPVDADRGAPSAATSVSGAAATLTAMMASGGHLLLLSSDIQLGEGLERLLVEQGIRVALARSASAGLEQVRAERPELVIVDTELADRPGLGIARELRGLLGRAVPIVALIDSRRREEVRSSFRAGFDAHLLRPGARGAYGELLDALLDLAVRLLAEARDG